MPRADTRGIFTLKIFTVYLYKEGSGLWPDPGKSPNEEKRALTGFYFTAKAFPLRGLS